ncbi:hypothetical protein [Azospirillum halopraeferens]|uniref:hypothetical protein n=1 Tax=Azospirillum halopraeferens TaxID=34010 RepID=UPI00041952D8|nr:hypothetical protein [Azospirillum halopraeferens]
MGKSVDTTRVIVEIPECPPGLGDRQVRDLERLLSEVASLAVAMRPADGGRVPQEEVEKIEVMAQRSTSAAEDRDVCLRLAAVSLVGAMVYRSRRGRKATGKAAGHG